MESNFEPVIGGHQLNHAGHDDHVHPVDPARVHELMRHHPLLDYLMAETVLVHKDRGTLKDFMHLLDAEMPKAIAKRQKSDLPAVEEHKE